MAMVVWKGPHQAQYGAHHQKDPPPTKLGLKVWCVTSRVAGEGEDFGWLISGDKLVFVDFHLSMGVQEVLRSKLYAQHLLFNQTPGSGLDSPFFWNSPEAQGECGNISWNPGSLLGVLAWTSSVPVVAASQDPFVLAHQQWTKQSNWRGNIFFLSWLSHRTVDSADFWELPVEWET